MIAAAVVLALQGGPDTEELARVIQARADVYRRSMSVAAATKLAQVVLDASSDHSVPVALILAVIESESGYKETAVSSANCNGLMQVHPNTSQKVLKTIGLRAAHNVTIGTAYLSSMFLMFGRWDHALSAYNKGPARFSRTFEVSRYARQVLKRYQALTTLIHPHLFEAS